MDFESMFSTTASTNVTLKGLLISLVVSLVLGLIISLVYKITEKKDSQFNATLIILPAVITIIIMLIGNSVARAFSLAGAFTIVRFRSIPTSPKGLVYVLISMAIGLACGMGFIGYGIIGCVALCAVMIVIELTKYGRTNEILLKMTVPENLDFKKELSGVLEQFTKSYKLKRIKTDALGSLYKLQYNIQLLPTVDEKEFIDELRKHNGNLNISLQEDFEEEI